MPLGTDSAQSEVRPVAAAATLAACLMYALSFLFAASHRVGLTLTCSAGKPVHVFDTKIVAVGLALLPCLAAVGPGGLVGGGFFSGLNLPVAEAAT